MVKLHTHSTLYLGVSHLGQLPVAGLPAQLGRVRYNTLLPAEYALGVMHVEIMPPPDRDYCRGFADVETHSLRT